MSLALESRISVVPPRIFPREAVVAIPIPDSFTLEIPTTPLFVDNGVGPGRELGPVLPIVQKLWGTSIGTDTRRRTSETVFIGGKATKINKPSSIARISQSGQFPHDRSFEWMEEGNPVADVIVINGKEYAGVSTKAADFKNVKLEKRSSLSYPGGVRIYGLETEAEAYDMVKASNWLLKNGITSEVIWSVSRPQLLPWVTNNTVNMLSPEAFKERLYKKTEDYNQAILFDEKIDIAKARHYIDSTDFVIINRATTVPFRLSDLRKAFDISLPDDEQQQEFIFMMNYMFSYLNRSRDPEEQFTYLQPLADGEPMEKWEPVMSRFWDYFAKNLGTKIGTLHKHGVSHGFLHRGNIVADGTFCDLDSLEGPPFGQQIDYNRINRDVIKAMESVVDGVDGLGYYGVPGDARRMISIFIEQYMNSRWGESTDVNMIRIWKSEMISQAYLSSSINGQFIERIMRQA